MLTIAYYFLQVVLCSGMLMGYYWLVLRNKRFHQYNRFFLLAAALLSWIVPLIKITWNRPVFVNEAPPMMNILSVVADNNSQIEATITRKGFIWNWDLLASGIYFTVAAVLFFAMIHAFVKLYRLMRHHSCKNVGEVFLILTHAKGTPFSFFRYIFWNEEIDIRSEAGQQILKHELTHVQQKHSFDKLFIQLMLIGGWFNPFFWLLRREMEMIHEFIADKKAVHNGDTSALAQMLLTAAYPQQKFAMTHPFFFSPIKRRLLMLTNNRNPRFSYIRRMVVLPLLAIVIVLFAFRSKEQRANGEISIASVVASYKDEIKDVLLQSDVENSDNNSMLINGRKFSAETIRIDELKYLPYVKGLLDEKELPGDQSHIQFAPLGSRPIADPLYIVNGHRITSAQLSTLEPNTIKTINVFKGADAITLYGDDGANGVIEITLKSANTKEDIQPEDGRFTFVPLSAVVKDSYNNIAKNRKVYLKVIVYKGEEKTKVFEETHETNSDNDGLVSVKIGNGTVAPSSKTLAETDLSSGPFYVNLKAAIVPSISATWWVAESNYVDLGFSKLTVKDNLEDKPVVLSGFSGTNRPSSSVTTTVLTTLSNGDVQWRDPVSKIKVTASSISFKLADGNSVLATGNKENQDNQQKKTEEPATDHPRENTLNEVTVVGYGSNKAENNHGSTPAHFPGGQMAWEKYLMRNLNRDILKNNNAPFGKYTVVVSFLIDKEGKISDVRATNDPGYGTRTEAERIILKGPKWVPATDEKGEPMLYRQKQNISFILADEKTTGGVAPGSLTITEPKTTGTITGGTFSGTLGVNGMTPPSFPGGLPAWTQYLKRNANSDFLTAKGAPPGNYTVRVSFMVGADGSISDVRGENDPGYGAREQAEKLFTKGPRWVPAAGRDGKPLAYRHKVSITFAVKEAKTANVDPSERGNGTKPPPHTVFNVDFKTQQGSDLTIAPNTTAIAVVDIPGVTKGDPILVTPQKDNTDWGIYSAWVSAENKVSVRFANYTEAEVKIGGNEYKVVVVK